MSAAWFALIGTLSGVIVTLLGNALLESERSTATRRDAAFDREAANLRALQSALAEFALVWGPILITVMNGAPFNPMAPANANARPGETYSRVLTLSHQTQIESIRTDALDWIGRQFEFAKSGQLNWIANIATQRQALDTSIADRVRFLESPPPTLAARIADMWRRHVG